MDDKDFNEDISKLSEEEIEKRAAKFFKELHEIDDGTEVIGKKLDKKRLKEAEDAIATFVAYVQASDPDCAIEISFDGTETNLGVDITCSLAVFDDMDLFINIMQYASSFEILSSDKPHEFTMTLGFNDVKKLITREV